MMGTRAAAFAGKISNLRDSILRIQNGTMPQPTCLDLANMMKYFSQVLHDFRDFKDIENIPLYAHEKQDRGQLINTLPNFDYCGLYQALNQLVDILPLIPPASNGLDQLGSNLLMLFKCLVPFLDQSNMETMPYLVTTLFMSLPQSLHKDILDTLCFNLLPFTIDQQQKNTANMLRKAKNQQQKQMLRANLNKKKTSTGKITHQESKKPIHCIVRIEDVSDTNQETRRKSIKCDQESFEDQGICSDSEQTSHKYQQHDGQSIKSSEGEEEEEEEYALLSVTSILMMGFHYIAEPVHHSQLIECLMKLKSNVFEDLLFVIAYGTTRARCPAVELLFRYWPEICPNQQDRKNNSQAGGKLKHVPWQPTKCQNKNCSFTTLGDDEAVKMCLDFKISIALSDLPPPMLICLDCVDSIYKQQLESGALGLINGDPSCAEAMQANDDYSSKFIDLLLPMEKISKVCENKKCKSADKSAVGTCFDIECANYNCKRPIRYCKACLKSIHEPNEGNNYDVTLQTHICHSSLNLSIMSKEESVNNYVEAIISLLKEAAPADRPSKDSERYLRSLMGPMSQFNIDNKDMNIATEEKQLISQYGIWLMTGLCETKDKKQIGDELLGRLLGMLFQWFHFTACLPDDQAGSALEKLKGECIKGWIMEVKKHRREVFISCLLPHPIDCSKLGGHWEVWPDTAHQIKEGFKRLLCLVPYDIITDDIWDEIMPFWMECFRHEVPENELSELKILLSKVFDPELSPLGFETKQMYNFISSRFADSQNTNQEQTLYWLQIITMLEIPIPIDFLFQMLKSGVKSLATIRAGELDKLRKEASRWSMEKATRSQRDTDDDCDSASTRRRSEAGSSSGELSCADDNEDDDDDDDEGDEDEEEEEGEDGDKFAATNPQERTRRHRNEESLAKSMSINEDDVLLPAQAELTEEARSARRPLSQQEKQAQARAAFSARLLAHASQLNAQHSRPGSSSSTGAGPLPATQPSSASQSVSAQDNKPPAPGSTLAPTLPGHTRPLKSTSSSTVNSERCKKEAGGKGRRARKGKKAAKDKQAGGARPKLKLKLNSTEDYLQNKVDNNLICYILMLDILLKQLDLQEINSHRGLDGKEAQQAIELLNTIISTPWIGRHTCCDSLSTYNSSPSQQAGNAGQQQQATRSAAKSSSSSASGSNQQQQQQQAHSASNVHSFSHCAQGFEHEDSYETCVFCEIISTFHQLAMFLIEYFSPVIEVSICEVSQEAANGEFEGKPDYSRIGLDHLEPRTSEPQTANLADEGHKFDFSQQHLLHFQQQEQPNSPFSPSYLGPSLRCEVLGALPKELQLTYNLLVQFHQYQTADIVSQLLQMIKLISLHSQVLSKAAKSRPEFITWCQHNMLVNKLWSLCQLESSEIARTCVPLLLHCITLPWGVRLFRDLVERDFNSDNWLSRFRAVERVVTIAYFCEPSTIKNSTLLQSSMASAFCYVVRCLDDIEAIVAQRALVSLEMMKTSSLKLLLWCLEVQFDYIIIDRPMILRSVFQLYNHLKDRRFLTWEFFLNRFDTLFLEAQIYLQKTGEIPSFTMQDLKNTNTKSEIYQKKIMRAREALLETHQLRSLSVRFNEKQFSQKATHEFAKQSAELRQQYKQAVRQQRQTQQSSDQAPAGPAGAGSVDCFGGQARRASRASNAGLSLDDSALGQQQQQRGQTSDKRRALSPMRKVMQHGRSISSRYQTVAFLTSQSMVKRKNSKFMANLAMQSVPPLMLPDKLHQHLPNSFVDDGSKLNEIAQENHVFGVVHRVCDEDRDTNHSLIFLLMNFFSKPDPSHPQTVKTLNRNHQIVLRHLNILMGYSVARKNFLIPATNLRLLPVFNAFLTSLPKVLDFNYSLGTILLDTCLPTLIYCPAPEDTQYDTMRTPTYSLWLLNPLLRQSWLMSVMAFLYKYQFGQAHLREHVYMLMWIVVNTLEAHLNCSTLDASIDRCLANVRDSTATQDTSEETTLPKSVGHKEPQPAPVGATSTVVLESPNKTTKLLVETTTKTPPEIEPSTSKALKLLDGPKGAAGSKLVATSPSGASFVKEQPGGASPKPLIKADTSDSLNVKAKLFQRKPDSTKGMQKAVSSAGSPSAKMGECVDQQLGKSQAGSQQGAPLCANTNDERLLPIGAPPAFGKKARPALEIPAAERLLPIGPVPIVKPTGSSQQSKEAPPGEAPGRSSVGRMKAQTSGKLAELTGAHLVSSDSLPAVSAAAQAPLSSSAPNSKSSGLAQAASAASGQAKDKAVALEVAAPSEPGEPTPSKSARRGRFGTASTKQTFGDSAKQEPEAAGTSADVKSPAASKSAGASSSAGAFGGGRKGKSSKLGAAKEYVPPKQTNAMQASFSSPSLLNEQLAQINRHSFVQEFSDKDLSMCLVILETFIHHEPSMAAQMLPNILRLVARYSSASHDSWQTGNNMHLVGGSMFVARQFIRVALHDLMENNIFHQIFTSHFTGYEFYKSMATALADFADLNQLAPLSKLFEDLNKQKNLPPATSLMTILENVATYFECIIAESSTHSQTTWTNFINNWENFLRKLILALPRYSGTTITTTTSTGRADGTSSMAHVNTSSSHHHAPSGSTAGTGLAGANVAAAGNQFLASNRGATAGASNLVGAGANQDTANVNSANAIPSSCSMIMTPIMRIILSTSKIPHLASCKTIVDPYSKIISYTVLNSQFKYEHLLEINHNFCRLCTRDREKYLIQRTIAYELVQVLKFRFFILEENLLILLLFILQDVNGTLSPRVVKDSLKIDQMTLNQAETYVTNVSECLRQYIGDLLEFITDVHAISRINDNLIGSQPSSINRDSFGGHVKAAISQYLALEMSLSNGADNRSVLRYLPWLYTSPSLQQGPREFIECVSHIRQLSWIILGSLQHSTLMKGHTSNQFGTHHSATSSAGLAGLGGLGGGAAGTSGGAGGANSALPSSASQSSNQVHYQPIPIEKNGNVAEHVQVILAGFAEQSKESVLHMSGLFHAFLLCQLWTMYCENICSLHPANSEQYQFCQSTLDDFWAKITPGVLRLVGHSRVMSEMVSTHFLQLIESLIESNSSILIRYLPMWNSVFYSYKRRNKSGNLAIRLQKCIEWQPPDLNDQDAEQNNKRLLNWLEKVQYKMSHIEIQSSQAAPFYLT